MAFSFVGWTGSPADNGSQVGSVSPSLVLPAGTQSGDLLVVLGLYKGNTDFAVNGSGQTWEGIISAASSALSARIFWCQYDSSKAFTHTFSAIAAGGTIPFSHILVAFRPTAGNYTIALDAPEVVGTYIAPSVSPWTVTIPSITTVESSTVTLGFFLSTDDNTWGGLAGTNWLDTNLPAQLRNTGGTDTSMALAYQIRTTAGATGNVSKTRRHWVVTRADIRSYLFLKPIQ
jgi:hypothetical protein